jgi:hypothetical protein
MTNLRLVIVPGKPRVVKIRRYKTGKPPSEEDHGCGKPFNGAAQAARCGIVLASNRRRGKRT